ALFYGELEAGGTFIYVNAGHVAPFHLRADGSHQFLIAGGPVLGPLPGVPYERGFVQMEPGDLLVLFTDGIVETHRDDEEFGVERLLRLVAELRHASAADLVAGIFAAVEDFGGGLPAEDDRTVVVVKRPS